MQRLVKLVFIVTLTFLFEPLHLLAASPPKAPTTAGGFSLNTPIENYPIENYANYLNEVIVTNLDGFRKGFITYGTCRNPGKILRIKLKYNDRSFKFFQELLKRYKNEFGAKPKFSGDQFGNVKSWKWSFKNLILAWWSDLLKKLRRKRCLKVFSEASAESLSSSSFSSLRTYSWR